MGNTELSYPEKFEKKYGFVELVEDENFGLIKVYRKKELNFDYVMILDKYMEQQQLNVLEKELTIIQDSFLKADQPMILKIFSCETSKSRYF